MKTNHFQFTPRREKPKRKLALWTGLRAGKAQLARAAKVKAAQREQKAVARRAAPRKRIAARSETGRERDKEYRGIRDRFMMGRPWCEACCMIDGLTGRSMHPASEPHHKRGRGKYLLDTSTWIPVCRKAHTYIGDHPAEALKLGLIESRLNHD